MRETEKIVSRFFDFYSIYELYLRIGGFREEGYPGYSVFVNERIFDKIKDKYNEIVDTFYEEVREALIESIHSESRHFPRRTYKYKNNYRN